MDDCGVELVEFGFVEVCGGVVEVCEVEVFD